eukprot:6278066-Amphidinium_carterae.1
MTGIVTLVSDGELAQASRYSTTSRGSSDCSHKLHLWTNLGVVSCCTTKEDAECKITYSNLLFDRNITEVVYPLVSAHVHGKQLIAKYTPWGGDSTEKQSALEHTPGGGDTETACWCLPAAISRSESLL